MRQEEKTTKRGRRADGQRASEEYTVRHQDGMGWDGTTGTFDHDRQRLGRAESTAGAAGAVSGWQLPVGYCLKCLNQPAKPEPNRQ
jgi:hypothetical protein